MTQWQLEISIPKFHEPSLEDQVVRKMLRELEDQKLVRREVYHLLKRKHQGAFVSSEGADAVSAMANAALAIARALESVELAIPSQVTITLRRNMR